MKKYKILLILSLLFIVGACSNKQDTQEIKKDRLDEIVEKMNNEYSYETEIFDIDNKKQMMIHIRKGDIDVFDIYYIGIKSNENFIFMYNNSDELTELNGFYLVGAKELYFLDEKTYIENENTINTLKEKELADINLNEEELQELTVLLYEQLTK